MISYDAKERLLCFFAFLRNRIDGGVKQKEIAEYIDKSAPYINKLYRGIQKTCPEDVQVQIADYFGLSYEAMINEGKLIMAKNLDTSFIPTGHYHTDGEISDTVKLDNLISRVRVTFGEVISEIKGLSRSVADSEKKLQKLADVEEELEYFKLFHQHIDEGLTFFNDKREFVYSSNRWKFLDGIDIRKENRVESLLLHLRKNIRNIEEVGDRLMASFSKKEPDAMEVELINGNKFYFRTVPIFNGDVFLGMLLINNPVSN